MLQTAARGLSPDIAPRHPPKLREPHARQREFLDSKAKRKVIRAGRRGGKTTGIAIMAIREFLAGKRVLYATPTQEQVDAFWWEIKQALAEALDAGVYYKNESLHVIELAGTKQRIRAKTAWNADTLRGDYADLLILDEWQLMDEQAWQLVGAPMMLDTDGDAVFIYTPPSLRTRSTSKARDPRHAAKLFKKAQADETGRWEAFHFTSRDNPHISMSALSELSADMSEMALRQEIDAEDIDEPLGAVFGGGLLPRSQERWFEGVPEESSAHYGGIDWGFHATVLEVAREGSESGITWVREEYMEQMELSERLEVIVDACKELGIQHLYADAEDATANNSLAAALNREGLAIPVTPVPFGEFKGAAIDARRFYLERGLEAMSPDCPRLMEQSAEYRYAEETDKPVKLNDHAVDSATAFYASRAGRLMRG